MNGAPESDDRKGLAGALYDVPLIEVFLYLNHAYLQFHMGKVSDKSLEIYDGGEVPQTH